LIFRADKARKNSGKENNILPPITRTMATSNDKMIIKVLTLFATFLLLALASQDSSKKTIKKINIPLNIRLI
jgi:hypothetical protein